MFKQAILSASTAALFACSSAATNPGGPSGDTDSGTAADASAPNDAAPVSALLAPVLVSVEKMHGGLHVTWTNTQKGCDAIEGERKLDADFKLVFTVPDGTVDNKHDALGLVAGKAYTYRVRCKKAAEFSPYSEEMKGTP
jgi:hypothetical protein